MGSNPFMMAGRMTDSTATAMENAASNPNGAMAGFMGMGMVGNMGAQGGFGAAQSFYNAGVEQQKQFASQQNAQSTAAADGWQCACGAVVTGNFCSNCGAKKPQNTFCSNCGKEAPAGANFCSGCGNKLN